MLQHLQDPVRRVHPAEQAPQEVLRHRHRVDTFITGSGMPQGVSSQCACRLLRTRSMPGRGVTLLLMACHRIAAQGAPNYAMTLKGCPCT